MKKVTRISRSSKYSDYETKIGSILRTIVKPCKINKQHSLYEKLLSIVKMHPNASQKIGLGIDYFEIVSNKLNQMSNSYTTILHRLDGTTDNISILKCFQINIKNSLQILKEAMRYSVKDQTIEFREKKQIEGKLECAHCGNDKLKFSEYDADHIRPFCKLSDDFLRLPDILSIIPTTFDSCPTLHLKRFYKKDEEFENKWKKYHQQYATLQLLCRKCNLRKSSTMDINHK